MVIGSSDVDAVRREVVVGGSTRAMSRTASACPQETSHMPQHELTRPRTIVQHISHRNMAPLLCYPMVAVRDGCRRRKVRGQD
jgi:hypothetical protein